jgi:hypothetical protein
MRRLVPLLGLVLLAVACGTDSTTNSTFERIPTAIAFDWVNAVASADGAAISRAVEQQGLVVVTAAENAYTPDETAVLLQDGLSTAAADVYWTAFREEFAGFAGTPFRDLEVGVYEEFAAAGGDFAVVTLRGGSGTGTVVALRGAEGWQVDMAATVGPAFAGQIRNLAEQLDDSPASSLVAAALQDRVLPGLLAAAHLDPDNATLQAEIGRIRRALENREPSN